MPPPAVTAPQSFDPLCRFLGDEWFVGILNHYPLRVVPILFPADVLPVNALLVAVPNSCPQVEVYVLLDIVTCPPESRSSLRVRIFARLSGLDWPRKGAEMSRKRFTAEQIIHKLRQAEVELANGQRVAQVCKTLGISEQTY